MLLTSPHQPSKASVNQGSNSQAHSSEIAVQVNHDKKLSIPGRITKGNTETAIKQMLLGKWCQETCSRSGGHNPLICKKKKKKNPKNKK